MLKNTLTLAENEFIINKINTLDAGCTLIESPTGTGKTTFVLEHLTQSTTILMLVPLVLQVRQLKSQYGQRTDLVFLSGTDKDSTNNKSLSDLQGKHIVATYDLWPALKQNLSFENYTLVVDEVHKMYSAGSYRDEALNPILDIINNKTLFSKRLLLTATYTPLLANLANIIPDSHITILRAQAATKKLTIRSYEDKWSYHWLKFVINRLQTSKPQNKVIMVRLNSNSRMDKAIQVLEKLNFKVLGVSRKTIGKRDVKTLIENQKLPQKYDVILTTSILDEAINLNNDDSEIDSVHIVDASAHPEEIVQFMGRLRVANPPFFLHINKTDNFFTQLSTNNVDEYESKIKSKYTTLENFAHASKQLAIDFDNQLSPFEIFKGFNIVNTTLQNFLECPILTVQNQTVSANVAGILACCYKLDIFHAFKHYEYLKTRLTSLLPTLVVVKESVLDKKDDNLQSIIDNAEIDKVQKFSEAVKKVCQHIKDDLAKSNKTLLNYAQEKNKILDKNPSQGNPFNPNNHPIEYTTYFTAIDLSTHLTRIEDVERALINKHEYKVIELSKSYRTDFFKNDIRKSLQKRFDDNNLIIKPKDAVDIVLQAFRNTRQKFTSLNSIKDCKHLGIKINSGNQHISIAESKALKLIKDLVDVTDTNSHKPQKRYLQLVNMTWNNYQFNNASRAPAYENLKAKEPPVTIGNLEDEFA